MPGDQIQEHKETKFENHLEQADILKNQLEMLNEITNQFHELMRLSEARKQMDEDKNQVPCCTQTQALLQRIDQHKQRSMTQ